MQLDELYPLKGFVLTQVVQPPQVGFLKQSVPVDQPVECPRDRFYFRLCCLGWSWVIKRQESVQEIGGHLAFPFHLNRTAFFKLIFI